MGKNIKLYQNSNNDVSDTANQSQTIMEKITQEEWLKAHYNESPSEGPPAKRVKFEDVYNDISSAFPRTKF